MAIEGDIQIVLASLVSGRAYPLIAPDPIIKPYIIYQVISAVEQNGLDGATGLINRRIQINCYHTGYGTVKTLAASVKTAMAASTIRNIHLSSQDLYEDETQLYCIIMDFSVWS